MSANSLVDTLANEGVGQEGLEPNTTWNNIPNGQLREDCIQLATKDREASLSKEGRIEEGSARPFSRNAGPRKDVISSHLATTEARPFRQ
jgi:hypothetical protein